MTGHAVWHERYFKFRRRTLDVREQLSRPAVVAASGDYFHGKGIRHCLILRKSVEIGLLPQRDGGRAAPPLWASQQHKATLKKRVRLVKPAEFKYLIRQVSA
jgi:hypothetical protein